MFKDIAFFSSTTIYVEGMVFHSNMSTAEGRNTSVFISVPAYQLAPGSLFASSNNTCTIVPIAGHTAILQILVSHLGYSFYYVKHAALYHFMTWLDLAKVNFLRFGYIIVLLRT